MFFLLILQKPLSLTRIKCCISLDGKGLPGRRPGGLGICRRYLLTWVWVLSPSKLQRGGLQGASRHKKPAMCENLDVKK